MNAIEVSGLGNISFCLSEGGSLGVAGDGRGQLLRRIMGLESHSGTVNVLGADPRDAKTRQNIGVSLGAPGLPESFTLKEISGLMADFYKSWHEKDFEFLSGKLSLPQDKAYSAFTDVEKRKLALAIAMAPRPKVLILLDPLAGIEGEELKSLHGLVKAFAAKQEHTLLITGEDRAQLESLCTEIISADKEGET